MNGTERDDGPDYANDDARAHYVTVTLPEPDEHERYVLLVQDIDAGRLDKHLGRLLVAIRSRMTTPEWLTPGPR